MWQDIKKTLQEQKRGCIQTIVGGKEIAQEFIGRKWFYNVETDQIIGDFPHSLFHENVAKLLGKNAVRSEIIRQETQQPEIGEAEIFVQPLAPVPTLWVLGAGHIALPLVEIGDMMGFKMIVIDDRPDFANLVRFPKAKKVICDDFATTIRRLPVTEHTYIVVVTRGHKYDQLCVEMLLDSQAAYIGMIGSRRRVSEMRKVLEEQGFSEELLAKLHSPIGLDIGAETPEEIALCIIAEVVSARRKIPRLALQKRGELEIQNAVVEALANIELNGSDIPAGLATVVEVKGSAPRKPGAQMLVFADGRTVGSIGGGCAEAEICRAGRMVLNRNIPFIWNVDLTNDIAGEEGMVCGGTMKVFLQKI
ncbi:XdhC family protein [Desulfitobacterium metallireducens]|uniref:Xanthine dehydrogenase n=1 Tax=Desulfitobacterium metallireducens DSM 15288 TaxID=871968 RepID=W0ECW6_9FIRM|nr:XdhC/CoxI family protein [Desulfitobacterium metallireducens]AHF07044.1 xanthine dehydrogenase [Desulfitobacterium metallireducens DSM 15288]